jgi:hypothetical protein
MILRTSGHGLNKNRRSLVRCVHEVTTSARIHLMRAMVASFGFVIRRYIGRFFAMFPPTDKKYEKM